MSSFPCFQNGDPALSCAGGRITLYSQPEQEHSNLDCVVGEGISWDFLSMVPTDLASPLPESTRCSAPEHFRSSVL